MTTWWQGSICSIWCGEDVDAQWVRSPCHSSHLVIAVLSFAFWNYQ